MAAPADNIIVPPALADGPLPSSTGLPVRVLVIEDHRDSAHSLKMLLEILGHQVRVAYSSPEGVQVAAAWAPAAVLSDIGLPGLDGYGVAAALRQHPATARALLIAISGYGREEDVRRALDAGFHHYLVKPASPSHLQSLLAAAGRA